MENTLQVFTGKNFSPLFKGAKAEVITLKGSDGGPQALAQFYKVEDAKLFASAPDLLHELTELLETFKGCLGGSDPLHYEDFKDDIKRAESAIHKAKNG